MSLEPLTLWLWKNFVDGKKEYWAFDNPFPIYLDCDDPQVLGPPCGYAIFKESRNGRPSEAGDSVTNHEAFRRTETMKVPKLQETLMLFDPATGADKPYPSHSRQWREYHGPQAWLFNPWTGKRRHALDVGNDVFGHLIVLRGEPLHASGAS